MITCSLAILTLKSPTIKTSPNCEYIAISAFKATYGSLSSSPLPYSRFLKPMAQNSMLQLWSGFHFLVFLTKWICLFEFLFLTKWNNLLKPWYPHALCHSLMPCSTLSSSSILQTSVLHPSCLCVYEANYVSIFRNRP